MAVQTPIPMKNPGDYISWEEAERILSQAKTTRDKIVIGLLWRCGLRAFEIGRIKKKDIIESENVLIIFGKGSNRMRIPVEPELFEWIKSYASGLYPEDFLISCRVPNKGISRFMVWHIVKKYSKMAGIEKSNANIPIHPHTLRHSLAIWLVKMAVPLPKIQQILRHSSLVPTTYYLQFSTKELSQDYLRAWELAHSVTGSISFSDVDSMLGQNNTSYK